MAINKIEGTADAWENDELGADPKHAQKSKLKGADIDKSMGLQMISIRLQKTLIDDLKAIADYNCIGYQPLMKQILKRFTDSELRRIANECMTEQRKKEKQLAENEDIELSKQA